MAFPSPLLVLATSNGQMANANDFTVAQLLALANVDGKLNLLHHVFKKNEKSKTFG